MRTIIKTSGALICVALLSAGCSQQSDSTNLSPSEAPGPQPAPAAVEVPAPVPEVPMAAEAPLAEAPIAADSTLTEPTTAAAAPTPATAPPVRPAAAPPPAAAMPAAAAPLAVAPVPSPAPTPVPAPAPVAQAAPAPAATAAIVDPGGVIAVAATKAGLTRTGPEECGDCHDVQFTSWSEGPHGSRNPPLDCEHCHGPGSEYKPKAIMKDPAKARAAGLVMPDKDFCAKCHKTGVNDDLMKKVHAHEE